MSAIDTLNYQLSSGDVVAEPNIVAKKSMLKILDQNTTYNSGSSRINLSSISNSTYIDLKQAYLEIPVLMTLTGTFSPNTSTSSCDYSMGLMNFYHNIIHSISVLCNGQVVCYTQYYQRCAHASKN